MICPRCDRICHCQYCSRLRPRTYSPFWDFWLGFSICAPLYGYGIYKLIFG